MNKINDILENRKNLKKEDLDKILITDYAFDKMRKYSSLVCKIFGKELECGGYLIAPKHDTDCVVKDIFLSDKQNAGKLDYSVDAEADMDSIKKIQNKGYKVMGWWHSHAGINPFHSTTDDENFKGLYFSVFPYNKKEIGRETVSLTKKSFKINYKKEDNGKNYLILKSPNFFDDYIEIEIDKISKLTTLGIKSIRRKKFKGFSFAYSIVINRYSSVKPYGEIAIKYPNKDVIIKKDVKIKEISSEKEILNYKNFPKEIKKKVIPDEVSLDYKLKKNFGDRNSRKDR
jgi:proteasome lid subunit RPN8/RPN11